MHNPYSHIETLKSINGKSFAIRSTDPAYAHFALVKFSAEINQKVLDFLNDATFLISSSWGLVGANHSLDVQLGYQISEDFMVIRPIKTPNSVVANETVLICLSTRYNYQRSVQNFMKSTPSVLVNDDLERDFYISILTGTDTFEYVPNRELAIHKELHRDMVAIYESRGIDYAIQNQTRLVDNYIGQAKTMLIEFRDLIGLTSDEEELEMEVLDIVKNIVDVTSEGFTKLKSKISTMEYVHTSVYGFMRELDEWNAKMFKMMDTSNSLNVASFIWYRTQQIKDKK